MTTDSYDADLVQPTTRVPFKTLGADPNWNIERLLTLSKGPTVTFQGRELVFVGARGPGRYKNPVTGNRGEEQHSFMFELPEGDQTRVSVAVYDQDGLLVDAEHPCGDATLRKLLLAHVNESAIQIDQVEYRVVSATDGCVSVAPV